MLDYPLSNNTGKVKVLVFIQIQKVHEEDLTVFSVLFFLFDYFKQ